MNTPSVNGASPATRQVGSSTPPAEKGAALDDGTLRGGTTTDLGELDFPWPEGSFADLLAESRGSAAGHSAVSNWLTCPEASRLKSLRIQRKPQSYEVDEMNALAFGTLCHVLGAIRPVYGEAAVYELLAQWASEIGPEALLKADLLFKTYDLSFPLELDPFRYLGVESEVLTDIRTRQGAPCIRTVRYDAIIKLESGEIFSFEKKTMARSGAGSLSAYTTQAMVQVALWNANEALVQKYGTMRGVIFDCLIKTVTPNVERVGPKYYSNAQQNLALDYMRLPDDGGATFSKNPDGTFPRMLHACFGRWRACEFVGLCHDEAWGDYEDRDGNTYAGPDAK